MPAGFNKGQIEYIKTLANVNGHKTYYGSTNATQAHTAITGTTAANDTRCRYAIWALGGAPVSFPEGTIDANTNVAADSTIAPLSTYSISINQNLETATETQRVSPECFLESVNIKMRHITDIDNTIDSQSHKEFRLVVFRHREKQHPLKQHSSNFANPLYDMFYGAGNYKYGPKGYTNKQSQDGNVNYVGHSSYTALYDRDAMLTDSINTADYVVMKDCRYYLGREYGGKHIYEDRFFWDHEDPISTDQDDVTTTDTEKNYCWYIMLLGVNNVDTAITDLGYVRLQTNTYLTSG